MGCVNGCAIYLKRYAMAAKPARHRAVVAFYNDRRPHQALADRMPMAVWRKAIVAPGLWT